MHTILSHFDLKHRLLASFLGFWCYITAIFSQMCLMLDQFLWGHSSRVCDISCYLPFLHVTGLAIILSSADVQADLRLCCLHATKLSFSQQGTYGMG